MSRSFLRNSVLTLAALFVAGLVPTGFNTVSAHALISVEGPDGGGGGGTTDPGPCTGDDCVARAL